MMFDEGEPAGDDGVTPVLSLLMERILQQERVEMDRPHVLICRAPDTGVVSYQGPYASGLHAVIAADAEASFEVLAGSSLEFTVAPLHPHDAALDG